MRNVCLQRVHSPFSLKTRCAFAIRLRRFSQSGLKFFFFFFHAWTVHRLCVTGTNLGQRKHNEFRACALLVPSVRLALGLRFFGVGIHTWKNAHIFYYAKIVRRG